jgi:hypothetical protein
MAVRAACPCACLVALSCSPLASQQSSSPTPTAIVVPRLWDDAALADWATPLAGLGLPPTHLSAAQYYAAPVDNLRTYPVYHPAREPKGYRDSLLQRGPQPLIDMTQLHTETD